jgi:histidine triad (HIT) family protein
LTNQDCIFCKIISGEFNTTFVAESKHSVAFNDINPAQKIHVLVVPREHHSNISELAFANPEALVDLIQLGSKVAAELSTGSFRLQFNTGEAAGQTVFHVHGHVLSTTPKA